VNTRPPFFCQSLSFFLTQREYLSGLHLFPFFFFCQRGQDPFFPSSHRLSFALKDYLFLDARAWLFSLLAKKSSSRAYFQWSVVRFSWLTGISSSFPPSTKLFSSFVANMPFLTPPCFTGFPLSPFLTIGSRSLSPPLLGEKPNPFLPASPALPVRSFPQVPGTPLILPRCLFPILNFSVSISYSRSQLSFPGYDQLLSRYPPTSDSPPPPTPLSFVIVHLKTRNFILLTLLG